MDEGKGDTVKLAIVQTNMVIVRLSIQMFVLFFTVSVVPPPNSVCPSVGPSVCMSSVPSPPQNEVVPSVHTSVTTKRV